MRISLNPIAHPLAWDRILHGLRRDLGVKLRQLNFELNLFTQAGPRRSGVAKARGGGEGGGAKSIIDHGTVTSSPGLKTRRWNADWSFSLSSDRVSTQPSPSSGRYNSVSTTFPWRKRPGRLSLSRISSPNPRNQRCYRRGLKTSTTIRQYPTPLSCRIPPLRPINFPLPPSVEPPSPWIGEIRGREISASTLAAVYRESRANETGNHEMTPERTTRGFRVLTTLYMTLPCVRIVFYFNAVQFYLPVSVCAHRLEGGARRVAAAAE